MSDTYTGSTTVDESVASLVSVDERIASQPDMRFEQMLGRTALLKRVHEVRDLLAAERAAPSASTNERGAV